MLASAAAKAFTHQRKADPNGGNQLVKIFPFFSKGVNGQNHTNTLSQYH